MKKIGLLFLLLISTQVSANPATLPEIRSLYKKAVVQEKYCKILSELQIPENAQDNSAITGYKAAATIVMAKYVFNPVSKMNYFTKGKNLLEKAIGNNTKNVELRYLRFTIQTNAPSFLGYSNSIKTDRQFLSAALPGIKDMELKHMIFRYLSDLESKQNH